MVHIFIINSHAGNNRFSAGLRRHLAAEHSDLEYYIFHTRKARDERDLMKEILRLFGSQKIRVYCCGGSGTISNAIYGIEDFSNLEFAFYPKGFTNDFLKVFGNDESRFGDIDELINGEAVNIDYIKTNHGNCLNTFSIGLDSEQVRRMEEFRDTSVLGKLVPYTLGFIYGILFSKPKELEIEIDGENKIIERSSELFFGNGAVIGGKLWFDTNPVITDGKARVVIYKHVGFGKMFATLLKHTKKQLGKPELIRFDGYATSITVRKHDGTTLRFDYDGELQEFQRDWTAEIVNGGLPFVVPKGVEVK